MYKKTAIQLLLILLLLISLFFFYNEYNKKNTEVNFKNDKIINKDNELDESEGDFNLLKNIKYVSKDSSNNIYEIYAEEGRVNSDNPDITLMKNVKAYIFLNEEDVIEIISKYANYNSLNYNTYFREKKSGHISIVSSVAGYRGLPAASGYCASKSALIALAESLYFDFKRHNVRVSVINPGFIKTPMTDKNKFPMPMIKSAEFAAEKMFIGLTKKNAFEIHFPIAFTMMMKLLKIMPNWLYLLLLRKGMKTIRR